MKPNFFVRLLFVLLLFTLMGISAPADFSDKGYAIALNIEPRPSASSSLAAETPKPQSLLSFSYHQDAANSYRKSLPRLRNTQLRNTEAKQRANAQAQDSASRSKNIVAPAETEKITAPKLTPKANQNQQNQQPSPYDIIAAARKSKRPYPVSLTPPTLTPPKFAQQLPKTLGQTYHQIRDLPPAIQQRVGQQVESTSKELQLILNRIKNQISDTLDQIGSKAHQTAKELRDSQPITK